MEALIIDQKKCDRSPNCAAKKVCPASAIYKFEGDYIIENSICLRCKKCVRTCPKSAVKVFES